MRYSMFNSIITDVFCVLLLGQRSFLQKHLNRGKSNIGTLCKYSTCVFVIKPNSCTNFTNLFWHETLHVSDSSSVHHQEFIHCTLSNGTVGQCYHHSYVIFSFQFGAIFPARVRDKKAEIIWSLFLCRPVFVLYGQFMILFAGMCYVILSVGKRAVTLKYMQLTVHEGHVRDHI
jgi:hypothetical protein